MKKIDVFLVRFVPIVMLIYIGVSVLYAWNGIVLQYGSYIFSNSFVYSLVLFFISLADKKYHCVWNRAMYIEMMLVPLLNYAQARFHIFPVVEGFLVTLTVTWFVTILATVFLAVRHFLRPRIKRQEKRRGGHGR